MKKLRKISALFLALMIALTSFSALAAPSRESVSITNAISSLAVGESYTFRASSTLGSQVDWTVTDSNNVVSVDSTTTLSCTVSVLKAGTFKVTASATDSYGQTYEDTITVAVAVTNTGSIRITDSVSTMNVGETYIFKASMNSTSTGTITWDTNESPRNCVRGIADSRGQLAVTALKAGTVRIYAYAPDQRTYDYVDVVITETDTKLVFENMKDSMNIDETYTFSAYKHPSKSSAGVTLDITAVPSNAAKINYTGNGQIRVTVQREGYFTITAQASGMRSISNTVTINAKSIAVSGLSGIPSRIELSSNETYRLSPTISPSNATNKTVSYKSSNTKIATVDANGVIKGNRTGTATITVTTADGGYARSVKVYVTQDVEVIDDYISKEVLLQELRYSTTTRLNTEKVKFNSKISGTSLIVQPLRVSATRLNQINLESTTLASLRDADMATVLYDLPWVDVYIYPEMVKSRKQVVTLGVQKIGLTGNMRTKWNRLKLKAVSGPWKITGDNYKGLSLKIDLPGRYSQSSLRLVRWNGSNWVSISTSGWQVVRSSSSYYVRTGLLAPGTYAVTRR